MILEVQTSRDTLAGGSATPPPPPRAKISATGVSGMGCDRALQGGGGGCSCDTPATHSKLRKEPRRGYSYFVKISAKIGKSWIKSAKNRPKDFKFDSNSTKSQLKSTKWGLFISHLRWWERTANFSVQ